MANGKVTKLTIREDESVSVASSLGHANLTAAGFNIEFILRRRPSLAVEIARLFDQARQLRRDDPQAPEEDFRAANDEWLRFLDTTSRD